MGVRVWIRNYLGYDKLAENLKDLTNSYRTIIRSNEKTNAEDETCGYTYDRISEAMREAAITNESIPMLAWAYRKGVFGAKLSIQNMNDDDNINDNVEKYIRMFCKQDNFEVSKKFHFDHWNRKMSEDIIREGGILIRKHKATPKQAQSRGWKIPYKIEYIEISSIDWALSDKEKRIYNGVEVDKWNAPKRLHFKDKTSVPFSELIMYSVTQRITQINGVSTAYVSLDTIKRQDKHATAETDNAIEQAKVSDVYTAKVADAYKIKQSGDFQEDLANATAKVREIDPRMPEKDAKIIDKDEKYERLDRGAYSSAFDSLNKFANTKTAAGSGLTLDEYTGDLSDLTFHGGQVAQIKNDETYSIIRDDLIELVINPYMTDMLEWSYITSYLDVPPENISLHYIKRPRKSAQLSKDAAAYDKNYKNGFMTKGDIVKEISGENLADFEKRRLKEELLMIKTDEAIIKAKIKAGLMEKPDSNATETNSEGNTSEN